MTNKEAKNVVFGTTAILVIFSAAMIPTGLFLGIAVLCFRWASGL